MANLPGFPGKRFGRNGIGQRAGGAVQPVRGGGRGCPSAAVAWQVHAAGFWPQDPSEAAGAAPESSRLHSLADLAGSVGLDCEPAPQERVKPTPPPPRYGASSVPPFCLGEVCALRPRRCSSASEAPWLHASEARRACSSGRGLLPRAVRLRATSCRHWATISRSRCGPPGCFERAQGLRGCIVQFAGLEHFKAQGAPGAADGAAECQKSPGLMPANDSAPAGQELWAEGGSQGG